MSYHDYLNIWKYSLLVQCMLLLDMRDISTISICRNICQFFQALWAIWEIQSWYVRMQWSCFHKRVNDQFLGGMRVKRRVNSLRCEMSVWLHIDVVILSWLLILSFHLVSLIILILLNLKIMMLWLHSCIDWVLW